jgi:hypothetical protein
VARVRIDWAAVRFHAARWVWVPALAALVAVSFPRSAGELTRLLAGGAVASQDVVAPFNFVVNKSDDELQREAEELAGSARPIYEFQQRAYDSATAALEGFFEAVGRAAARGPAAVAPRRGAQAWRLRRRRPRIWCGAGSGKASSVP